MHNAPWLVLLVACLGLLLDTLDGTVVNVALPTIRASLGFSEDSLVWVPNGYLLPYGGFLILSGRLGDHYGHLRTVLAAVVLFTVASVICGLAVTWWLLVVGRVIQGLGAAAISASSLAVILQQFTDPTQRARALGIYTCVSAAGGSAGILLGGILTDTLGWRWIFFFNLAFAAVIFTLSRPLRVGADRGSRAGHLDIGGAATVTTSLLLATCAVLSTTTRGWSSAYSWLPFCGALVCAASFIGFERRAQAPLVSLSLFRHRNFSVALLAGALQNASLCIWFFISALYLQRVLGYAASDIAMAFLPVTLTMAVLSFGLSAKLVVRVGAKTTVLASLLLTAAGLALLARAPVNATFARDVLPGMLILGLGAGLTYNPLTLSAMHGVRECDYGAASGVMSSAAVMVGALALAAGASLSTLRTDHLLATGTSLTEALTSGYHLAFMSAALCAAVAALISSWIEMER